MMYRILLPQQLISTIYPFTRVNLSSLFTVRFHFFCTAWVCGQTAYRGVCSSHLPPLGKNLFVFVIQAVTNENGSCATVSLLCIFGCFPIIHFTWFTLRVTRREKAVQKPLRPKGDSSLTRAVLSSSPQALFFISKEWIKGSFSGSIALFIWMVASIVNQWLTSHFKPCSSCGSSTEGRKLETCQNYYFNYELFTELPKWKMYLT